MKEETIEQISEEKVEEVKQTNPKRGRFLPLWIITPILYAIITIYLAWSLLDVMGGENQALGIAIWLSIIFTIFGTGGYIVCEIPAIIGLILTCVKKPNGLRKGQLVYFMIFIVLPIVTYFAFILIVKMLTN